MPRRLPPLSALRSFEATARTGSVSRAADELGRTHGAVSRQLRSLQDHAGIALFDKVGTGLRLNAHGVALQVIVTKALDELEHGYRSVLDDARGSGLHVACSATFAMRWLVPNLPSFYRRHPDTRIRLSMTSAREIRHEGADLVLAWDRRSYPPNDEARAFRFADVAFGPVCAPNYPVAVSGEGFVCKTRIVHEHTSRAWDTWQNNAGKRVRSENDLMFPHTHLCIEAALSGLGVALVERRMVRDEIAGGRLIAQCGFVRFDDGLAAVPTSRRADSEQAKEFVAWLRETMTAEDTAFHALRSALLATP